MKSETAKKWIADIVDPQKSTSGLIHAVELAEVDARERAVKAFCLQICGKFYPCKHGAQGGCSELLEFLKHYDNDNRD